MAKKSSDFVEAMSFDAAPGPVESTFAEEPEDRTVVAAGDPDNAYGVPFSRQHYEFNHDVFVIFRPYESCVWCKRAIKDERMTEPDVGDLICKHTRRDAYHALIKQLIEDGYRKLSYKEETLKNGTIQVSISWAVPKRKEARRKARLDL